MLPSASIKRLPRILVRNRAEHRFADGYELVVFDLPAANGYPAVIGWELFGGLEYVTQVTSGQARASVKPRPPASARSNVGGSQTSAEGLSLPVHIDGGGRTHGAMPSV